MPSPDKDLRLKLLELLYAHSTAPESEKAEVARDLESALDEARRGTVFSRQDLKDYLRRFHFQDYYRMRKAQERGQARD